MIEELQRRGFVLHYVVDATEGGANLQTMVDYLPEVFMAAGLAVVGPQLTARQLMRQIETEPSEDLTAIKPYIAEGHMIADQVVVRWHQDRRSSAYLNLDFNDDSPALPLDIALSPGGQPTTIVVWRQEVPPRWIPRRTSPRPLRCACRRRSSSCWVEGHEPGVSRQREP